MPPPNGMRVPTRPAELDAVWLSACLRHAGVLGEAERVAGFDCARIGEGSGFAGQVARVALRYEPPSAAAPATLIAKFASDHASTREMMSEVDGYAREVRFYRELAPEIGVGTPRCYFAHYDRADGGFCLLLEDLTPSVTVAREQGLSFEQAQHVLEQLAAMHARFWNKVDRLQWLRLDDRLFDSLRERFIAGVPGFVARHGDAYPTVAKVARQFLLFFAGDEVKAKAHQPPQTIAHNDMHSDNVFLPGPQGGRFALIDWQSVTLSRHGTSDVARVLCMGMRPELRRRHADALLRHYHRALCARGVRDYPLRSLRFRYRQELITSVLITVLAFETLDFDGHEDATPKLIATRVDAALVDAHVSALLTVFGLLLRARRWLRGLFSRA